MRGSWLLSLSIFLTSILNAQVEIYRGEGDTATYIAPKDTITTPPKFENGDLDFYRYLETHMNLMTIGSSITYAGANFKFSFYVERDGDISDFKMISFGDAMVAHELERVMYLMPKWQPGIYVGKKKKTLMVYDVFIRRIDDFNSIEVTPRDTSVQYTRSTNPLKWALVVSSVLLLLGFIVVRS
ncbi:MAG: hypothetical protein JNM67_05815 [Bacteroidetes bacterium]|jgi:hypothetical protein|nr:hypothetical protein [Bacteroidota bacterium]